MKGQWFGGGWRARRWRGPVHPTTSLTSVQGVPCVGHPWKAPQNHIMLLFKDYYQLHHGLLFEPWRAFMLSTRSYPSKKRDEGMAKEAHVPPKLLGVTLPPNT